MKTFYWNPETLMGFKLESKHLSTEELKESVEEFVEMCCHLEDGETEEDLVNDLMKQIKQ